jgi:hypothetical protein
MKSNIPFYWLLPSKNGKLWLWLRRFLFVLGGGVLGLIATWIFAFLFYGVPFTTSGLDAVNAGALPVGVVSGCIAGGLVVYHVEREN